MAKTTGRALALACAALLMMAAGGCARHGTGSGITLRLVLWGNAKDEVRLNKLLASFKRANPGVNVKLEITPHGRVFDKLLISFAGGRAPDVTRVSSLWFYPLAAKGVLADITDFIKSDPAFDFDDFYPVAVDGWCRYKNRIYAMPTDLDLQAMFYNRKMFDKAGIPYPDDTWTWETFLQAARKMTLDTDGDGKLDQWGATQDGFWQSYVYQNGGSILNEDNTRCTLDRPEAYEAIQWMVDLRRKWKVTPSPSDAADVGTFGLFTMGRVGMLFSGSWTASLVFKDAITSFEYDVAPVPRGVQRATFLGGSAFAVVESCRHKKEAWELVKFLTGKEAQRWAAREDQIMPSRRSVAQSGAFLKLKEPPDNRKAFIDAVAYGRTLPSVYSMREMNDIIYNFVSMAVLGRTTAREACEKVTPIVNDLLEGDRQRGR